MGSNLKKSDFELFYKSLIYKSNTGLIITEGNGKILKYNLQALELVRNNFNYQLTKPLQIHDIFEFDNQITRDIKSLLKGEHEYFEHDIETQKSEESKWVRFSGLNIEAKLNQFLTICIFTLKDITRSKHKELKVRKKEKYFNSISQHLSECIFRSNLNEGLLYVNNQMIDLFEYGSEEAMLKLSLCDLCEEVTAKDLLINLKVNDTIENELLLFRKKNGETFKGLLNCRKYLDTCNTPYIDGTIINMTEIDEHHLLIKKKNEELKKLNEQLDRFFYSASHDLKSPLTSILGLCQLLEYEKANPNKVTEYVDMVKKSVEKLNDVLEDTISFSKNSGSRICSEKVDVGKLVDEIIGDFKRDGIFKEQVDIQLNVENQSIFYSDIYRLELIIKNVLKNAFQYIDIAKKRQFIHIDITYYLDKLVLNIIDNGIGIAPAHLPKIYNMFYRATYISKGSGIGLYIVKEAIDKINGNITIDSKLNKGTSVSIEVPNGPKGRLIAKKLQLKNHL